VIFLQGIPQKDGSFVFFAFFLFSFALKMPELLSDLLLRLFGGLILLFPDPFSLIP